MAYINREYDDQDTINKIYDIRPGIAFGDDTRIVGIEVDPPVLNSPLREVQVTLVIPLTAEEFSQVFSKPVR